MTQQTRIRHKMIMEIIEKFEISSQEELVDKLAREGLLVSQTTISRDIRHLRLEKKTRANGQRVYEVTNEWLPSEKQILMRLFQETVISVETAMNLIVIKTRSGSASAAAEAIDSFPNKKILGTIAGDNTIFVAVATTSVCEELAATFRELL